VPDQRTTELIDAAVARHVERWAKTIKLTRSDARFTQFGEDVTKALNACIGAHIAEQHRAKFKLTRVADIRRHLKKWTRDARVLAKRLRNFNDRYPTPTLVLHPGRMFDLAAPAKDLDALASLLDDAAAFCKDRGGLPRLQAFQALAEGLISAYRHSTEQRGTGRSAREGRLLDLVEAVLPTASKLAGRALKAPAKNSLGDYLHRIAMRL
jgi:hypothetical protein